MRTGPFEATAETAPTNASRSWYIASVNGVAVEAVNPAML
jgi:hypothetical protein